MSKSVKSLLTNSKLPIVSLSTSSILVNSFQTAITVRLGHKLSPPAVGSLIRSSRKTTLSPLLNPHTLPSSISHQTVPHSLTLSLSLASSLMASTEDSPNYVTQRNSSSLPLYPQMILSAIEALDEKEGSSKAAISKQMEAAHPDLPPAHPTLLSHHLNKMKQSGELVMVKNNYMKADPNAPPKRGRGRPPKPKSDASPDAVVSSPRPRGRPPKAKDPFAPISSPKSKTPGSGRPRGRPPKKAKTDDTPPPATPSSAAASTPAAASPSAPASATPRGRGRPPKVKPAVAAVAG